MLGGDFIINKKLFLKLILAFILSINLSIYIFSISASASQINYVDYKVKITKKHTMLKVGLMEDIIVKINPNLSKQINKGNLIWKSSNEDIVEVNMEGEIFGKNIGKSRVTVQTKDGKYSDFVDVKVVNDIDYKIYNPYKNINWSKVKTLKSNLHCHTNKSDGKNTIQEVVDAHEKFGYDVLSITDHNKVTYPWNDSSKGDSSLKMTENLKGIPGNEYSYKGQHHINGYFVKKNKSYEKEVDVLKHIARQGGLSYFNHPGGYKKDYMWYINFYKRFNSLIGLEVINNRDGCSKDRILWDDILTEMIYKRNIYGFANADLHRLDHIESSYNMMLLNNEFTNRRYKNAMKNGEFYFVARVCEENNRMYDEDVDSPFITNIEVDNKNDTIKIEGKNIKNIEWIGSNSRYIGNGDILKLNEVTQAEPYVRAVIKGDGGVAFTQPFKIIAREKIIS